MWDVVAFASLPLSRFPEVGWFDSLLGYAPIKSLLPLPILAALAPAVWWFFKDAWREADAETAAIRQLYGGEPDRRPMVCLCLVAVILTVQEYYGGRAIYE